MSGDLPVEINSIDALRKFISEEAGSEKAEEVIGRFQKIVDRMKNLSPEDREEYLKEFGDRMKGIKEQINEKMSQRIQVAIAVNIALQIIFYVIIALIVVFIGRKLYKHLKAKENKQVGKKKVKEDKKAKQKDENKKGKKPQEQTSPKKKK